MTTYHPNPTGWQCGNCGAHIPSGVTHHCTITPYPPTNYPFTSWNTDTTNNITALRHELQQLQTTIQNFRTTLTKILEQLATQQGGDDQTGGESSAPRRNPPNESFGVSGFRADD